MCYDYTLYDLIGEQFVNSIINIVGTYVIERAHWMYCKVFRKICGLNIVWVLATLYKEEPAVKVYKCVCITEFGVVCISITWEKEFVWPLAYIYLALHFEGWFYCFHSRGRQKCQYHCGCWGFEPYHYFNVDTSVSWIGGGESVFHPRCPMTFIELEKVWV